MKYDMVAADVRRLTAPLILSRRLYAHVLGVALLKALHLPLCAKLRSFADRCGERVKSTRNGHCL